MWSRCCVRELCSVVLVVLLVSLGFVVWGPYGGRVAWLVLPVPCRARCGAVGVWCVEVVGLLVPVGFASRWSSLPRPAYQPSGLLGASPTLGGWRSHLEAGFPLRCFQRLSHPNVANQPCTWRYNWHTRGSSVPVLSYWGQPFSDLLRAQRIGTELSHDVLNPARVPL